MRIGAQSLAIRAGLAEHVSFEELAARIDTAAPRPSCAYGGRPPYPTVLMNTILVLQHLYNLADNAGV